MPDAVLIIFYVSISKLNYFLTVENSIYIQYMFYMQKSTCVWFVLEGVLDEHVVPYSFIPSFIQSTNYYDIINVLCPIFSISIKTSIYYDTIHVLCPIFFFIKSSTELRYDTYM